MTIGSPDWQDVTQPQPTNDILYTGSIPLNTIQLSGTLAASQGVYEYVQIQVSTESSRVLTAEINDPVTGQYQIYSRYTAIIGQQIFYLPVAGFIGNEIDFALTLSAVDAGFAWDVEILGLRSWPDGLRFDGLRPPQGQVAAGFANQTSSSGVGNTPTTPNRILVGAIVLPTAITAASSVGSTELLGYINGVQQVIANAVYTSNGMTANSAVPPYGLLLDPGTGMTQQSSSAVLTATGVRQGTVFYDVVQ